MRAFWVLTRLRLLEVLRSASSTAFLLALPLVLLAVVGAVFWHGHPFERRHVVLDERTLLAGDFAELHHRLGAIEEVSLDRAEGAHIALGKLRSRMASAAIVREGTVLVLLVGPRDLLFGRGLAASLDARLVLRTLEVPRFGYVHFLFPGVLTFSVLLSGLFGMGYAMVKYRQSQFLKKLATTTLPRTTFVASQIAARTVLVLLQIALLAVGAHVAFAVPMTATVAPWLALVSVLGLLTFMGMGFALACVVPNESLMVDVISTINLPLVLLSELFFPLSELPTPLAAFGNLLPTTHMVRLLRQLLLYETTDLHSLWPSLATLVVWMVLSFAVSLLTFRWHP